MIKKQHGFTMVELLITMVIFVLAMAAASNLFVGVMTQYKQQSKIVEANTEGMIGLELLKGDIEKAGSGLPRVMDGVAYNEFAGGLYNDAPNDPPRAIVFDDDVGNNNSDILVVKATNIAANNNANAWEFFTRNNAGALSIGTWVNTQNAQAPEENIINGDTVMVLRPKVGQNLMVLVGHTTFNINPGSATWDGLRPTMNGETRLIYGLNNNGNYSMPFNRADYYLVMGTAPTRCAPGTGVLVKATINHANGLRTELPIMDCVADMQVVIGRDTSNDGATDSWLASWPAGLTAEDVRAQFKEVRVYILAHEGQRDTTYNFPTNPIFITDPDVGVPSKIFDLNATVGATWNQYRWKVYTIAAKLKVN